MEPQPPAGTGPLDSLRALGATLLELIGTRAELAVVELREHGQRRSEELVLLLVGSLFLFLAILFASLLVVTFFWDTHRLAAVGGIALLDLGMAAFAFARLREWRRTSPPAFEATLRELAADRELLRGRNE